MLASNPQLSPFVTTAVAGGGAPVDETLTHCLEALSQHWINAATPPLNQADIASARSDMIRAFAMPGNLLVSKLCPMRLPSLPAAACRYLRLHRPPKLASVS